MYKAKIYCDNYELTVLFYDDHGPRWRAVEVFGLRRMIFDRWQDGGWLAFGIITASLEEGIHLLGEWEL